MIPSDSTLWRGIRTTAHAARCIRHHYEVTEPSTPNLTNKLMVALDYAIDLEESPGFHSDFFVRARHARTKTLVNRENIAFMRSWWDMMMLRSELWRVIKTRGIPCQGTR